MKNILLDAGHGNRDSGAISADLIESKVTLDVVLKVADALRDKYGIFLTRDAASPYISPSERLAIIKDMHKKARLDAFVSVHCNSVADSKPNGIETIYKDENDNWLALIIQRNLIAYTELNDRGVKLDDRGLAVLKAQSEIPCALVEIGFISNPDDHNYIETHIDVIADSIARAIDEAMA